jgi:hypothetical protein
MPHRSTIYRIRGETGSIQKQKNVNRQENAQDVAMPHRSTIYRIRGETGSIQKQKNVNRQENAQDAVNVM